MVSDFDVVLFGPIGDPNGSSVVLAPLVIKGGLEANPPTAILFEDFLSLVQTIAGWIA